MSNEAALLIIVLEAAIFFWVWSQRNKKIVNVPVNFTVSLIDKRGKDMLVYRLEVGPTVDHDVVERRLTVEVNGELVNEKVFSSLDVDLGELVFAQGDEVNLALVDVDDAGNVSEPAFIRFTAADTIPPAKPGSFSAVLAREVADDPVVVTPDPVVEPDPVVVPEPVVDPVVEPDPVVGPVPPVLSDDDLEVPPPLSRPSGDPLN
jgi:hypothetical protein